MASTKQIMLAYCTGYVVALAFVGLVIYLLGEMYNGLADVPYGQGLLLVMVGGVAVFRLGFEPITKVTLGWRYWTVGMLFLGVVTVLGTQLILNGYVSSLLGQLLMLLVSFFGGRELIYMEVGVER